MALHGYGTVEFGILRSTVVYFGYGTKNFVNIRIHANRPRLDFCWAAGLSQVDAGISCLGVLCCHSPERILDNDRRVTAHPKFQKQDLALFVPL